MARYPQHATSDRRKIDRRRGRGGAIGIRCSITVRSGGVTVDQEWFSSRFFSAAIGVGCPHAPPSCANLHSARRSRRHRLPFPAGSFIEGFGTPATVQAAPLRSAAIRNPQHFRTSVVATCSPACAGSGPPQLVPERGPGHSITGLSATSFGRYRGSPPTTNTNTLAILPSQVSAGKGVNACSWAAIVSMTAK